jgi:hypothetical protein
VTPPPAATAAARSKPRRSAVPATAGSPTKPATSRPPKASGATRQDRPPARTARASRAAAPARRTRPARRAAGTGRLARRVSGPARPPRPARQTRVARSLTMLRPLPVLGTIGSHAFRAGRSLPDSRLLDRLMRGRAWIVLVGVLLIGLVALNVSLLKLNAEAGHNAEKVKALRIQNTQLRAKVSRLASAERLERTGRDLGLAMSIAGRVRYLSARPGDGLRASKAIRAWGTLPTFAFTPLPEPPPPTTPAATEVAPVQGVPVAVGATGPSGVPAG